MHAQREGATELPLHPQDELECRRCSVHGHTYIGCMQKVYDVEIDLDLLRAAEARGGGFGAIRAMRAPLPMCRVEVESCYAGRTDDLGCVNPEFSELPLGEPTFRIFARIGPASQS
jgi:hypothetical protein